MNKIKNILLFLSISIGFYFLLESFISQENESLASNLVNKNEKLNDIRENSVNSNEIIENSVNDTIVINDEVNYSDASENLIITMLKICNYNANDFEKNLDSNYLFNSSSEKQLNAKNELIKKCKYWHDYTYSLSNQDIDNLENSRQSIEEQNKYFMSNMDKLDNTKTDDAKAIMETGGDSSVLTVGALMYLMKNDTNFIKAIAEELGTEDLSYITNSRTSVPFFYICRLNPSECSANSLQMLSVCLTNESLCGLNFIDYYRTLLTGNQFNDYMNIVEIIKRLVENEFFSI